MGLRTAIVLPVAVVLGVGVLPSLVDGQADAACLPMIGVAAHGGATFAIRSDATLWHWGENSATAPLAGQPDTVTDVAKVSSDGAPLALRRDGFVWRGGSPFRPVTGLPASSDIAAGGAHYLALSRSGTVWAWGSNYRGQLGDGTNNSKTDPVQVPGLASVRAVAAGDEHSLALMPDGTVKAWGENFFGQLGDGSHNNARNRPVSVLRVTGAVAIAAGQNASLALKSDGTVWEWGDEPNNVAPEGPKQVSGLTGIVAIAAGPNSLHWIALRSDGTVWTWGYNHEGQIGDGTTTYRWTPYRVLGLPRVVGIAASQSHSVAVDSTGDVWGWGRNSSGQLGDGTTTRRLTPVRAQHLIQCFTPDLSPSPSPSTQPTATPTALPTPLPSPSGLGGESPTAECRFARGAGEIVFGGYALVGQTSPPPVATTIRCSVTTTSQSYSSTTTVPGSFAVTVTAAPLAPDPITVCTYAEAAYPNGYVAITASCRES